jgi:hypothetical protein
MVSRAAPICMLFLRSHLRSITCGTVFRRIEEVTEDVRDDTRPETLFDDVLQPWQVPEKSFSGPARPSEKRKWEDDNLLTNMQKFRRVQLITAVTKVEVDDHGYIGRTAQPRAAQNRQEAIIRPVLNELPQGWFKATSPESGQVYYYNSSGATQWTKPTLAAQAPLRRTRRSRFTVTSKLVGNSFD